MVRQRELYQAPQQIQRMHLLQTLIDQYYEHYGVGGFLHIVLDDENTEAEHVKYCQEQAKANGDLMGQVIAEQLLLLSDEDRYSLLASGEHEPFGSKLWDFMNGDNVDFTPPEITDDE